jgi:hypothetical protein
LKKDFDKNMRLIYLSDMIAPTMSLEQLQKENIESEK